MTYRLLLLIRVTGLLVATTIVQACFIDKATFDCTSDNHCHIDGNGQATCDDGYVREDEYDDGNHRCVIRTCAVPAQPTTITGSSSPCPGSTGLTYSVTNVTGVDYEWSYSGTGATVTGGSGTNSITTSYSASATSGIWTVTPSNSCGDGTVQTIAVTIGSSPAQPSMISGNTAPCQGATGVQYSVTNVEGVDYAWGYSGTGATVTAGTGTNRITVTYASSATAGTWEVVPTNLCGTGTARVLAVTIGGAVPAQPSTITGNSAPCQGSTGLTYSVTNVADVNYAWSYSGTGATVTAGAQTNSITVDYSDSATSGTWTATPSNACGDGTARTFDVTTQSVPAQPTTIAGNASACQGSSESFSVVDVAGVNYAWTFPAGWTQTAGNTTHSVTVTVGDASGNIQVVPSNSCGNGTPQTLLVAPSTVPPQPSTISGNSTPCQGSSQSYDVTTTAGVTYNWTLPSGWSQTSGGTSNSITATVGATSGDIQVTPANGCGDGTARTLAVTTTDVPAQPSTIVGNTAPCQNASETYSVSNVGGVSYDWNFPTAWLQTSGGTSNSVTVAVGSGSGTIGVTPSNGCGNGAARTLTVTLAGSPHASSQCFSDDVYWYDSCGAREEMKDDCCGNGCSGGTCLLNTCPAEMVRVGTSCACVDRWEASNNAGAAASVYNATPWVNVDWSTAKTACETSAKRLCANSEWLAACQGPAGFTFPYGDTYDPNACNGGDHGVSAAVPTGTMSGCEGGYSGIFDMAGNVREWTSDCNTSPSACVMQGGYYNQNQNWVQCQDPPDFVGTAFAGADGGFRCCKDTGDDVWFDSTSGLTWQRMPPNLGRTWAEATTYCASLVMDGSTDWRLPTISELRTLVRDCVVSVPGGGCGVTDSCLADSCHTGCGVCTDLQGPGPGGCYWDACVRGDCSASTYWSASTMEAPFDYNAYGVFYESGYVGYGDKSNSNYVRCVR